MQRDTVAPASTEDELADDAVSRGRHAGGHWFVAAAIPFGLGTVARSASELVVAWITGAILVTLGLATRSRYWRSAYRQLGDATIQRARWRSAEVDRHRAERFLVAVSLVFLVLAFELWKQ